MTQNSSIHLVIALFACLAVSPSLRAQCPPLGLPEVVGGLSCRFDSRLTRLFTPARVPQATYRVYVSSASLSALAGTLRNGPPEQPHAWAVRTMAPLEAFGEGGPYDRARLARLYVGLRPRVARGAVVRDGRAVASVWLISPYPDPSLSRLEPGTLIIVFDVTRVR